MSTTETPNSKTIDVRIVFPVDPPKNTAKEYASRFGTNYFSKKAAAYE